MVGGFGLMAIDAHVDFRRTKEEITVDLIPCLGDELKKAIRSRRRLHIEIGGADDRCVLEAWMKRCKLW